MSAPKTCLLCEKPAHARGLCTRHYQQERARELESERAASRAPAVRYTRQAFEADALANEKPQAYESSPVLAALAESLEVKRDELIAAGADDAAKLEALRAIARAHRAQYRHSPCADWRRGADVEL